MTANLYVPTDRQGPFPGVLIACCHSNLGIAYEQEGLFAEAREAYEVALDLEPNNIMIQQNYDLFREINDRVQSDR